MNKTWIRWWFASHRWSITRRGASGVCVRYTMAGNSPCRGEGGRVDNARAAPAPVSATLPRLLWLWLPLSEASGVRVNKRDVSHRAWRVGCSASVETCNRGVGMACSGITMVVVSGGTGERGCLQLGEYLRIAAEDGVVFPRVVLHLALILAS